MSIFHHGPKPPEKLETKQNLSDPVDLSFGKLKLNPNSKDQIALALKVEDQMARIIKLKESYTG